MTLHASKERVRRRHTIRLESRKYYETLGTHIAETRKSLGLTQKELADRLGVSQQAVFAYEVGDRRVSVLVVERLAKIFGVSLETLIRLSAPPKDRKQRLSPRAIRHAERLQALPTSNQRFVIKIIDSLEQGGRSKRQ